MTRSISDCRLIRVRVSVELFESISVELFETMVVKLFELFSVELLESLIVELLFELMLSGYSICECLVIRWVRGAKACFCSILSQIQVCVSPQNSQVVTWQANVHTHHHLVTSSHHMTISWQLEMSHVSSDTQLKPHLHVVKVCKCSTSTT